MLGICLDRKRTNLSITNELKLTTSLLQTIHQQQLSYFGHVIRGEGLEATMMPGMGEGKKEEADRTLDGWTE